MGVICFPSRQPITYFGCWSYMCNVFWLWVQGELTSRSYEPVESITVNKPSDWGCSQALKKKKNVFQCDSFHARLRRAGRRDTRCVAVVSIDCDSSLLMTTFWNPSEFKPSPLHSIHNVSLKNTQSKTMSYLSMFHLNWNRSSFTPAHSVLKTVRQCC